MKKFTIIIAIMVIAVMAFGVELAFAGQNTQTSQMSLGIPDNVKLTIANANPSKTLSDAEADAAFDAGYVELAAGNPTLTVRANKKWALTAEVTTPFAAVDGYTKAVEDISLKNTGSNTKAAAYTAFASGADLDVAGALTGVRDDANPIQYKIALDLTKDVPGTYQAIVTYTLATVA